jgi:PAS domain S-box-containing protein
MTTVLIVENDGDLAIELRDMLSRLGYRAAGLADSGEAAVALLAGKNFDLVLMDMDLAGSMDSVAAAEAIHRIANIPIVFLAGSSQGPLLARARIAASYGYLIRPVTEQELATTLQIALHRHTLDGKLKENQIALEKSEAKYRNLFENSPLGIFRTSLDGKALAVNSEMARIVGCATPEEAIRDFSDLAKDLYVDPDRRREFVSLLQEHGEVNSFEYEGRRKDGETLWISMNAKLTAVDATDDQAGSAVIDGFAMDITERKRAEELLRQSEALFKSLFENHSAVKLIIDPDSGNILDGNQAATEFYGWSREDLKRMTIQQINTMPPQAVMEEIGKARTAKRIRFEFRHKRADGSVRDVEVFSSKLESQGKPLLFSIVQDITQRKRMEEALRESEEKHRALVAGLPDVVMRFDRQGRHLFVSENVSELVNLRAADFIGKTHRELGFAENLCRTWEEAIQQVFAGGLPCEGESAFKSRKGQIIHNWRLIPEKDRQGQVRSVLSISRDVTAYRRTEQEYQALFREMFDGFALHEIICNKEGKPVDYRFLAINPSFERLTGLKAAETVGRTVLEVLPGIEPQWIENYGRVALTGEPALFDHFAADLQKHFEITAYRPAPGQFACIFADITERKQAEAERKSLEAQLRQAQKMESIGTLAGGIAHDFNNILGAILGYAEMAREDCPPDSMVARDIEQVIHAGNRARELVKQILAFSRQAETERIPLQPAAIVKETAKLLRSTLPTTIAIELNVAADSGVILADPTQIHQILMNLCTNAYHAMEERGGTLTISLTKKVVGPGDLADIPHMRQGNFVDLAVADTGAGIAPAIAERIFDPYFTTKETGKGTGMGLAIVHGIVQSYGGCVFCHSQPGGGAVFHVIFPVLEEHALAEARPFDVIPTGNERILFVDDEEMLAEMGQAMLERLGYTVTVRTNSLEALTAFQNEPNRFDLVITDQTMPGMTGLDLSRMMLQIRPDLPIILCTGFSNLVSEERAKAAGIKAFALKPLARKEIAGLIREVLHR